MPSRLREAFVDKEGSTWIKKVISVLVIITFWTVGGRHNAENNNRRQATLTQMSGQAGLARKLEAGPTTASLCKSVSFIP